MKVQLSLHATHLKKRFGSRRLDPYAIITSDTDGDTEIGRTKIITNATDPNWTEVFDHELQEGLPSPITVKVLDEYHNDHEMGVVTFDLWEVYNSDLKTKGEDLKRGKGAVYLRVDDPQKGNDKGTFLLQLRALDLKNNEPGLFGIGVSDPFYEISRKYFNPSKGFVYWQRIYRSEYKKNLINPLWEEIMTLPLTTVCYGDLDNELRIAIYDYNTKHKHTPIGYCFTTARSLLKNVAVRGNADREVALEIVADEGNAPNAPKTGLLVVLQAEILEEDESSLSES
mmetsp:Transcript_5932/g.8831  ORF Transcript_5932/g.8831 Transcript_5932/m.8831 type:complete len:284 (+) Transcript_5932:170-1021(+)